MTDEILLSESNLERVYMDAAWNVRIEHTEAGISRLAARARTLNKRSTWRRWVAAATVTGSAAAILIWKVTS